METKSISQKLLEFQCNIETIKKDGKNEFFKKGNGKPSTYATLPNILSEVKPILNALKLVLTQPLVSGEVQTVITCSESGEKIQSGIMLPGGLNAQQTGSAITYFRRYTLCSLLSLEIDEDDDGNAASGNTNHSKPAQETTSAPAGTSDKPWLNEWVDKEKKNPTADWVEVLAMIGQGKTIQDIEKKWKLAQATKAKLVQRIAGNV
jgi:hypothetical protein